MRRRATAIFWIQRVVLAVAVVAIVGFGVRSSGSAIAKVNVANRSLWLASPANGTVVQANPSSHEPTASVTVSPRAGELLDVVQQGPSAVVLNRSSGEIGRIDGVSLKWAVGRTFSSASADLHLAGSQAGSLFLHDAAQGLVGRLDPALLTLLSEEKVKPGRASLEVDKASTLWTFDPQTGDVLSVRKDGSTRRQHLLNGASSAVLTMVDGDPYLADPDHGRVTPLSPRTAAKGSPRCFDADKAADAIITGSDSTSTRCQVFAVSPSAGVLHTTDLERNECVQLQIASTEDTVPPAGGAKEYGEPVAHDDLVFIPLLSKGKVLIVDALRNRVERLVQVTPPGKQFELVLHEGVVWFNNLAGADAGTLDRDGIVTTIRKYDNRPQGGGSGPDGGVSTGFSDQGANPVDTAPGGDTVNNPTRKGNNNPPTTAKPPSPATTGSSIPAKRAFLEDLTPKAAGTGTKDSTGTTGTKTGNETSATNGPASAETSPGSPTPQTPASVTVNSPDSSLSDRPKANTAPQATTATVDPNASRTPGPTTATTQPPPTPPTATLVARIAASAPVLEVGQTLSLVDRSLGSPTTWAWDFGDGMVDARQNPSHIYARAGRFVLTLVIGNGGDQARTSISVEVRDKAAEEKPAAQFTTDASTVEVGAVVQMTDRSVGRITAWEWDFGDNTKSNASGRVSHAWTSAGTFVISLTVRNEFGATVTQHPIVVLPVVTAPKAAFDWTPAQPTVGQTVLFRSTSSGNPTDVRWDFGNEQTASGDSATRRFDASGSYAVTLRVSNGKGSDRVSQTITVLPAFGPPVASFNIGAQSSEVNVPVQLTSTSSGTVSRVLWDFGDGTTSTSPNVQHAWRKAGQYAVQLTASNDAGSSQAGPVQVKIVAPNPRPVRASFVVRPGARLDDPAEPGAPVYFVDRSTGAPTTWAWDFGDGMSDARQNPTHSYIKPGTYTVRLKVTDGQTTDQDFTEVYVRGQPIVFGPVADFSFAPAKPLVGQVVSFTDRSANSPTLWRWDFGDHTQSSSLQSPSHTYTATGPYLITMVASNAAGASSKTIPVEVAASSKGPPTASLAVVTPVAERQVGRPITVRATTTGAVSTPVFTFAQNQQVPADGNNAASWTYTERGAQAVTMRVCWADDRTNCAIAAETITVLAPVALPQVSFSIRGPGVADQQSAYAGTAITFTNTSIGDGQLSWKWVIGNQTKEGREVTVTIDNPGDVAVSLTVANPAGSQQGSRLVKILIANPVKAAFLASNAGLPVMAGTPVSFTDKSTGDPNGWRWDFGDGTIPAIGQNPSHTFLLPGRYTVTLTASNATSRDTAKVDIEVAAQTPPKPRIQAIGATLTPGDNGTLRSIVGGDIRFSDAASGAAGYTAIAWRWDFGDGTTGATSSTHHVFTKVGTVTITVTATDRFGQSASDSLQIVIVAAPAAPAQPQPQLPGGPPIPPLIPPN